MNGRLIIIDGISNAGKTSFCEYLSNKGYYIIDEVPLFIKKNESKYGSLSSTVPKTLKEEKTNQKILLEAEHDRLLQAEKLVFENKIVVMDRSFLSTFAMAYALEKDAPFKGAYQNAEKLVEKYLFLLQNISSKIDIILIVFDVDRNTLIDRNQKRERPLKEEWIDEEFLDKQRISFQSLVSVLNGNIINTSDLSHDEIYKYIFNNNLKKI